jgi:hypothetical protein
MKGDRGTVVGVFADQSQARQAVVELRRAGFDEDQIGVVGRSGDGQGTSGLPNDPTGTRWEEGTGVGAAAGGATGLGLGLAVAAGLIPAIGPVIAGGALTALIASAGAGATIGTVVGGLVGLGVPEDEAAYYEGEFKSGRTVVTVRAGDRRADAAAILTRYGGYDRSTAPGGNRV